MTPEDDGLPAVEPVVGVDAGLVMLIDDSAWWEVYALFTRDAYLAVGDDGRREVGHERRVVACRRADGEGIRKKRGFRAPKRSRRTPPPRLLQTHTTAQETFRHMKHFFILR